MAKLGQGSGNECGIIDPNQYKNKNDYYHSFKTQTPGSDRDKIRVTCEKENLGRPKAI